MKRWRDADAHRRWHQRFRHSLRRRLMAMFVLLALGSALLFVSGTREAFSAGWRGLLQPLTADYVDRLAAEIGSPPDVARAQALVQRLPLSVQIEGPVVQWQSHPQRGDHVPHDNKVRAMFSRSTADGHVIRFGIGDWAWHEQPHWLGWRTLLGVLLLTAVGFAYARHLFKPLDDIRAGALRYGEGDFSLPIPQRRNDELGDLAAQVNAMADGLQGMLESQRGLLLAISHELRSPLTRARLNAELVADGHEREALLRDLGQMRDLISGLLEGERLAAGGAALQREPCDLNALVREVVAAQFADQPVVLALDAALPLRALDRARLLLLVRNLLDNALRHGGGGQVAVRTALQEGGALLLAVRDHGPGVSEAQLAQLAQPFYRPDAARTRGTGGAGGVGLGLYLCRLVARSHGGAMQLRNAHPGLEVEISLPPSA